MATTGTMIQSAPERDNWCVPCARNDHENCDGETLYGDPCQCRSCEIESRTAAEGL